MCLKRSAIYGLKLAVLLVAALSATIITHQSKTFTAEKQFSIERCSRVRSDRYMVWRPFTWSLIIANLLQQTWCCILLCKLLHPSHMERIGAIPAFGISSFLYYELHSADQYQSAFLRGGVAAGSFFGFMLSSNFQAEFLHSLPPVILISLVLSTLAHGSLLKSQSVEAQEKGNLCTSTYGDTKSHVRIPRDLAIPWHKITKSTTCEG